MTTDHLFNYVYFIAFLCSLTPPLNGHTNKASPTLSKIKVSGMLDEKTLKLIFLCFIFYTEEHIRRIVKIHCEEFVRYSNWSTLLPLLEAADLLDPDTRHKLMNPALTPLEKSNYFYLTSLPSQGKDAYTKFHKCLLKEKEHVGHKTLQDLISQEIY